MQWIVPPRDKPLLQPMLTELYDTMYRHQSPQISLPRDSYKGDSDFRSYANWICCIDAYITSSKITRILRLITLVHYGYRFGTAP